MRARGAIRPLRMRSRAMLGAAWASAAVAVTLALSPPAAIAQTIGNSGSDLLQPSLDGNPRTPPRFRRIGDASPAGDQPPRPGQFAATSRIGATPIYGSPTGLGEGNTGYDSSNTPRRKRKAQRQPAGNLSAPPPETTFAPVPTLTAPPPPRLPASTPPVLPEVHPAKAASRPGAVLPLPAEPLPISNPPPELHPLAAASRPGAAAPVPPPLDADESLASAPPSTAPPPNTLPLGVVPQRPLPLAEGDPYAALGIRAGSFLLLPAVDLSTAYSQNPERISGGSPSAYFVVAPELQAHSNWERHALDINIKGSYTEYAENLVPSLDVPYVDARADGRIDVLRDTRILLEDRFLLSTDNPGSPNLQFGLAKLPINMDAGGTLGIQQDFNRLSMSLKGTFDRNMYQSSLLTDGELSSNADRNFDQYAGILRVGYELDPGLKPFVEVQQDERIHDLQYDRSDLQRDSVGTTASVGSAVDLFGSLTGEMAVGYTDRHYADPSLPNVRGVVANGALTWQATALTTARLSASSQVYETVLDGASGEFTRDLALQIDHAFLRWLVGTVKAGYGTDNYVGSALQDTRYFVSAGLAYKFNRDMQIRGEVREDWVTASEPGFAYTATSFLLGLRLQR